MCLCDLTCTCVFFNKPHFPSLNLMLPLEPTIVLLGAYSIYISRWYIYFSYILTRKVDFFFWPPWDG